MYNPYMYDNERVIYPRVGEILLYTVNRGDNLYRLSKIFNSEIPWIKVMNNLENDMIHPNQQLLIPIVFQDVEPVPQPLRQSYDLYF